MNVLFTRSPLESAYGGAEVQILSLMKGLTERGHEVSFLGSCETLMRYQVSGIRYQEVQIGPPPVTKWGAVSFLWKKRNMQQRLIQSLEALQTTNYPLQTILMLSLSEKLLLTEWCTSVGMRVIWLEHDRIGRWLQWNPWLPMLRKLSTLATTVVVSSKSADIYRSLRWRGEIVTIPNGIDVSQFTPLTNPNPNPNSNPNPNPNPNSPPFRLGCIARLTHDKGVDLLIEAVRYLPDIRLTIIGTGREEQSLRSIATNYKLQTTNFQRSTNNISDFYHSLDCLVLPSRSHDPFGLVISEAMACGIPTICTDACGISKYLTDEDALIIRSGSTAALRDAIQKLMDDPDLREKLAQRGPEIARKKFSLERMIQDYESLLLQNS